MSIRLSQVMKTTKSSQLKSWPFREIAFVKPENAKSPLVKSDLDDLLIICLVVACNILLCSNKEIIAILSKG